MKATMPACRSQRGIALLMVLWIVTLLAVICAEFSVTMRTEATVTRNFKESEQAYYTAEAGINRAILELMRSAQRAASASKDTVEDTAAAQEEGERADVEYWIPGGVYSFDVGDMLCQVEIQDEGNKVDINSFLQSSKKNPEPLKQLLRKKIGLEGDDVDIVADSLIDWYDADNNITGVNGAENDYYKNLDPPYQCRNGDIPVIEELLLVKGIDEQILYGRHGRPEQKIELSQEDLDDILSGRAATPQEQEIPEDQQEEDEASIKVLGLIDIFSAPPPDLGGGAKVNAQGEITLDINTATQEQLLLLNGMTALTAAEIVQERRKRPFAGKQDRLPSFKNFFRWKDSITVSSLSKGMSKQTLRLNARGCSPDGLVCRSITCTILFSRNDYFFLTWKETN